MLYIINVTYIEILFVCRTHRDQFTFQITGGLCVPLLVQTMTRCRAANDNTQIPTYAPTAAPTAPTISRRLDAPLAPDNKPLQTEVNIDGPINEDALFW